MKNYSTISNLYSCAIALGCAILMAGCFNMRWPQKALNLDGTSVDQTVAGDTVKIQVRLKDASLNSAIWPISKIEEVGDGVIIVKSLRGGVLGNTSGSDTVVVKREPGKCYTLILRNENDNLIRISDFRLK